MGEINYPKTRRNYVVDVLHGVSVADPYRWLEEETSEVQSWEEQQNSLASNILENWPDRGRLRKAIYRVMFGSIPGNSKVDEKEKITIKDWSQIDHTLDFDSKLPIFCGNSIFHIGRLQGEQQALLFATDKTSGKQRILVNPNNMQEEAGLDWFYPSTNGEYVAYGISHHGDEQSELYVIETSTGNVLSECIAFTSFARVCWLPDSSGFYYSGGMASDFEDAEKRLFFHMLGDTTKKEPELVRFYDPYVSPQISLNERYLVVNSSWEKPCAAFYQDRFGDGVWRPFLKDLEGESYGQFFGEYFFTLTTYCAPRGRIVSIPMETVDDKSTWREVVPEGKDILQQFVLVDNSIVISELHNAYSRLHIISLENGLDKIVELPGMGLIESTGAPDSSPFTVDGKNIYFCYVTFIEPSCIYKYSLETRELTALGKSSGLDSSELDSSGLMVRQLFYFSNDGLEVPMFLVHKNDLDLKNLHNVLLNGYGGWNINPAPSYLGTGRTCVLPFIEAGGIYAFACLRGGCELGRSWWQGGRREKKQNTFNDLYAAAEYLVAEGITTSKQLAIIGASNGGLLTATAVTQRPDLFQVVVSEVPLTDMIRSIKDPYLSSYMIEYGDPDDPEMFPTLLSYSPVHNVKDEVKYPATFILSGKNDIRCQPWNGRKLAALLQQATVSDAPILLKVVSGGHGPGISLGEKVERRTDILGFIMKQLGMRVADDS